MRQHLIPLGLLFFAAVILAAVIAAGCSKQNARTSIADLEGDAEATANAVDPNATVGPLPGPVVADPFVFPSTPIYFDFDKFNIREDQRATLNGILEALSRVDNPITLNGYCDERGTIEYNLALGMRRAQAVRMQIFKAGLRRAIPVPDRRHFRPGQDADFIKVAGAFSAFIRSKGQIPDPNGDLTAPLNQYQVQEYRHIRCVSYGEEYPAAQGHDEDAWKFNRRVEVRPE